MRTVVDTLRERDNMYGAFTIHAAIAQRLKGVMHSSEAWKNLDPDQREALDMIQHKIARILNGNEDNPENFHDIAGYATLVDERLQKKEQRNT